MVTEWFIIPSSQEAMLRLWLTQNPEYKFRNSEGDNDKYFNKLPTYRGASENDVSCLITHGDHDRKGQIMITFSFKDGTTDDGLLGLVGQTFHVLESEIQR
ncbi:hypothetical protein MFFDBJGM_02491 [Pectobacterium versatile]|uniref:hypothetical protein n=1 Tax=Pectobacterium versatile TaxID=2488639 RepID=UPI000DAB37CA|nr:hypothetical protein [Pectobacterium versatile]GBO49473.1 hypothetical protein MFFDBJGM_02491 [Pectobacterium versatile]